MVQQNDGMLEENFQIESIGLQYIGHFNSYELRLFAHDFAATIPLKRIGDFVKLFPDVNWEDGYMLHNLCGRYLRRLLSPEGRILGFKHIVKDIVFMIQEQKEK